MINKNKFTETQKKELEKQIPKGSYCYSMIEDSNGDYKSPSGKVYRIENCPFWDIDKERPYQSNGYCHFLEKGDWDLIQNSIDNVTIKQTWPVEKEFTSEEIEKLYEEYGNIGFALLWDQCKECDISNDDE